MCDISIDLSENREKYEQKKNMQTTEKIVKVFFLWRIKIRQLGSGHSWFRDNDRNGALYWQKGSDNLE